MAGLVPLTNISRLPSHSSSCGPPACLTYRSGASSSACTGLQGLRNGSRDVPAHQLHSNGAFGAPAKKWHAVQNSKRKERVAVRSQTTETAETEQKEAVPTPTPTTPPPDGVVPEIQMSLEVRGLLEKQNPYTDLVVGKEWRKFQGEKHWEGLLDPLDKVLRGELIRYGEFTQVIYDSFDYDTHSRFCGSSKYSKERLLHKNGLDNRGYEVTDYIYGTAGEGVPMAKYFKFMDAVDESGNEETQVAWDLESNWMGYVAVTTDPHEIKRLGRRDIVVAWRGTVTKLEWLEDFRDWTVPTGLDPREAGRPRLLDVKVESGFLRLYKSDNPKSLYTKKSARRQLLEAIIRLLRKYGDEELSITVTGHSLGSALAVIAAYDIAETGVNQASKLPEKIPSWDQPDPGRDPQQVLRDTASDDVKTVPVTVYTFAGPRVGNDAFRDRTEALGVKMLRVENRNDLVPHMPGLWINERFAFLDKKAEWFWRWLNSLPWTYTHVGVALLIDNLMSPYLKKTRNPNNAHNLEGYMHVLTGFHRLHEDFVPAIFRDLALVNKACDFLHLRNYIPPSWWQEENKGLALTNDGRWAPRTREKIDYPEYDLDRRDADEALPPIVTSIK